MQGPREQSLREGGKLMTVVNELQAFSNTEIYVALGRFVSCLDTREHDAHGRHLVIPVIPRLPQSIHYVREAVVKTPGTGLATGKPKG